MKPIRCRKCGNTADYFEEVYVLQRNFFTQNANGNVSKTGSETDSACGDSRIFCAICNKEVDQERELFLDRYSDTLFSSITTEN